MQTMLRMVGFGDNTGSGFPHILAAWKEEGWIEPELAENTDLNQVTLAMQMKKSVATEGQDNSLKKVSEVLIKKNFDKVLPIVQTLEEKGCITLKEAEDICDRSAATVRTYLEILMATGIMVAENNTNNSIYRVIGKRCDKSWVIML